MSLKRLSKSNTDTPPYAKEPLQPTDIYNKRPYVSLFDLLENGGYSCKQMANDGAVSDDPRAYATLHEYMRSIRVPYFADIWKKVDTASSHSGVARDFNFEDGQELSYGVDFHTGGAVAKNCDQYRNCQLRKRNMQIRVWGRFSGLAPRLFFAFSNEFVDQELTPFLLYAYIYTMLNSYQRKEQWSIFYLGDGNGLDSEVEVGWNNSDDKCKLASGDYVIKNEPRRLYQVRLDESYVIPAINHSLRVAPAFPYDPSESLSILLDDSISVDGSRISMSQESDSLRSSQRSGTEATWVPYDDRLRSLRQDTLSSKASSLTGANDTPSGTEELVQLRSNGQCEISSDVDVGISTSQLIAAHIIPFSCGIFIRRGLLFAYDPLGFATARNGFSTVSKSTSSVPQPDITKMLLHSRNHPSNLLHLSKAVEMVFDDFHLGLDIFQNHRVVVPGSAILSSSTREHPKLSPQIVHTNIEQQRQRFRVGSHPRWTADADVPATSRPNTTSIFVHFKNVLRNSCAIDYGALHGCSFDEWQVNKLLNLYAQRSSPTSSEKRRGYDHL